MAAFRFKEFQGNFIKLRSDMEMTQEEFANYLGISRPTVGLYESGKRVPDALGLKNIAEKCHVSADYLLGLTDIRAQNMETRRICKLTGLSESTVKLLISEQESHLSNGRATFSRAFADIFLSEACSEAEFLQVESSVLQAAIISHFGKTKDLGLGFNIQPEDIREIYIGSASRQLQGYISSALNKCVDSLIGELEREQNALLEDGTPPDADFEEIAYGNIILESDSKEKEHD